MARSHDETLAATRWVLIEAPRIQLLRIGCSFVAETGRDEWVTLVRDPRRHQLVSFELSFGHERARAEHNAACLSVVRRTQRTHLGHRGGFGDLFVPVRRGSRLCGVLVCGPFLTERPTADRLRREWRILSGAPADANDEAFLRFVRGTLETHAYEGPALDALRSCLERLAAGMVGAHLSAASGWNTIDRLMPEVRMWDVAAEFVDRERIPVWSAGFKGTDRLLQGIRHMPNRVVAVAPSEQAGEDMVERLIRADALQRACAAFAVTQPDTLAGRMGDEAAFVLTHVRADAGRRRETGVALLAERLAGQLGRRLGWEVVCGISRGALQGADLPTRYQEAMWAVVSGLHRSERVTLYGGSEPASAAGLYRSARALSECFAGGRPKEIVMRAEQVASDVLWVSRGSIEAMRSHLLQVVWELVAIIDRRNVVDKSTSSEIMKSSGARLGRAGTTKDLAATFTELVRELADVVSRPNVLGRRAKLERARRLVENAGRTEPVSLRAIAGRVGLSARYLSHCFRKAYGVKFGDFVVRSRVERAKGLLRDTAFRVVEVSAEAGFSSPSYFHQAFRRVTGTTPERYRRTERVALSSDPPE